MKKALILIFVLFFLRSISMASEFSFAVFGDNRDGDKIFNDLLTELSSDRSISFALNTGDMTPHGWESEYNKYWDAVSASGVKVYDVLGNHDLGFYRSGAKIFSKKYGQAYYSFDHENCRFIIIDNSSSKGLGAKQWGWLQKILDTDKIKFVLMHEPLFDPSGTYPKYVMAPASENELLKTTLERAKVRYVFAGHIHGYGREEDGGIVYIITGGAGAPLYLPHFNGGYYHFVKVKVDGSNITDEVKHVYND